MNITKLDKRITIQQRVGTVDAVGQPVETWQDVAALWANIRHMKGMETIRAGAETSVVRASIRIRSRPGITNGMRVVWNNFVYQITAVLPQTDGERNQVTDLACERVTDTQLGD